MNNSSASDFSDITLKEILDAEFSMPSSEPVLKPFDSFVVADPSLLTPDGCHDGRWHMFFHTNLGVYHFDSDNGVNFKKVGKIVPDAMRPNINYIDGTYYLFYEKTRNLFFNALNIIGAAKWESEIYAVKSSDLVNWSEPYPVLRHTKPFEKVGKGKSLSNPYLLKTDDGYRLYYSCSLTFIKDCGFCEPTYINYAHSVLADSGYVSSEEPIIKPDKSSRYLNLCSGCLKVYRMADGYLGIQNGIYEKDGKSHSAIIMLTSSDGLHFEYRKPLLEPGMYGAQWMRQYVYASHLVRYNGEARLYFNGRDISNMIRGRECIGFIRASL